MDRNYDPVLIEVVRNELASITEEMAIAVHKTGRSAMVKVGDFATAIADGQAGSSDWARRYLFSSPFSPISCRM